MVAGLRTLIWRPSGASLALLTLRRAAGHESGGAEEPAGRRAGSLPYRRIRSPRCRANSTLARGETPRYGRHWGRGDQPVGTGPVRTQCAPPVWATDGSVETLGAGIAGGVTRRCPCGGIFRRRAGHESAVGTGDGLYAQPGPVRYRAGPTAGVLNDVDIHRRRRRTPPGDQQPPVQRFPAAVGVFRVKATDAPFLKSWRSRRATTIGQARPRRRRMLAGCDRYGLTICPDGRITYQYPPSSFLPWPAA